MNSYRINLITKLQALRVPLQKPELLTTDQLEQLYYCHVGMKIIVSGGVAT